MKPANKFWLVLVSVSAVLAIPLSYFTRFNYIPIFIVVTTSLWFNACIITWEDAQPGGWDDPDGTAPPLPRKWKIKFWLTVLPVTLFFFALAIYLQIAYYGMPAKR